MEKLDLAKARELLKAAMETQGRDFVYQDSPGLGCYNIPVDSWLGETQILQGSPKRITGCLVGTAMSLSGVIPDMSKHSIGTAETFAEYLTHDAVSYFNAAQLRQDNAGTWGSAFDEAEEWAEARIASLAGV